MSAATLGAFRGGGRFASVPRYYFHLYNSETVFDREGQEFPNDAVALQNGKMSARVMAADSVFRGQLNLQHRIQVNNERGETIGTVYFRDVVEVRP